MIALKTVTLGTRSLNQSPAQSTAGSRLLLEEPRSECAHCHSICEVIQQVEVTLAILPIKTVLTPDPGRGPARLLKY